MYENIKIEIIDKIAILKLDRADKLNALNNKMIEEIVNALQELNADNNVRIIVISGEGKAFCAGGDLVEASEMRKSASSYNWIQNAQKIQITLEESPKIILCSINGAALGGGMELALACDIRIASSNAVFAVPEINVGLLPCGGGMSKLSNLIGLGRAKEMVLTGRKVSAEEALSIGLVSEVVDHDKLKHRTMELAQELANKPPLAVALAKETMNMNIGAHYKVGLKNEARAVGLLFGTEDRLEGLKAFMERRKPDYKGE